MDKVDNMQEEMGKEKEYLRTTKNARDKNC